ncbi:MAG: InlB B-repeat-containing protein [Eubacteriales bacterium]|nr:InlB B-repeat-containing protein [Eubacteriales bacterium]
MEIKEEKKEPQKGVQDESQKGPQENPMVKKRWFGRGIYGSKDVPIRLLDGFIGIVIVAIVAMTAYFAVNGGFYVTFDSRGGSEVESQKLRHGSLVSEPETPVRPGYTFEGWYLESNEEAGWNFAVDKIEGDLTLVAKWAPAQIMVKFDRNGGIFDDGEQPDFKMVTFGETYGELPVPYKEGSEFLGWYYSGSEITENTQVTMNGEHVLTAEWN